MTLVNFALIKDIADRHEDPRELLDSLCKIVSTGIVFSTSFGWEDQVLSDIILTAKLPVEVFTLDTGRNFPETYSTWAATNARYGTKIKSYTPKAEPLERMLASKGPNSFYESIENRKECCKIRKLGPLSRALNGKRIWITGIRAEQSANRSSMEQIEWDSANQIIKIHPLINWSLQEVKDYIKTYNVPYNPLHDRGFPSIGCQPCTRAVSEGEDFRAGRWWWENTGEGKKECGLHN